MSVQAKRREILKVALEGMKIQRDEILQRINECEAALSEINRSNGLGRHVPAKRKARAKRSPEAVARMRVAQKARRAREAGA